MVLSSSCESTVVLTPPQDRLSSSLKSSRERERPPLFVSPLPPSLNISALKSTLGALQNESSTTAAEIKKNILYRRAELLLISTSQLPSFASFLSSDVFFASLLTPATPPTTIAPPPPPSSVPSSLSLLSSIFSLLTQYFATLSPQQFYDFFEKTDCLSLTLSVLGSLESLPSSSLPDDPLREEVRRWEEAMKKEVQHSSGSFWASGTGYGTDHDQDSWTRASSRQEKEEKDKVIASLLGMLSCFLEGVALFKQPEQKMKEVKEERAKKEEEEEKNTHLSSISLLFCSSPLVPYLSSTLPSLFEAEAHPSLQTALVTLLSSLSLSPFFHSLLCLPALLPSLKELDTIAGKILFGTTKWVEGEEEEEDEEEGEGEVELAVCVRDVCSFFRHDSFFILEFKEKKEKEKEKDDEEDEKENVEKEKEKEFTEQTEGKEQDQLTAYLEAFQDKELIFTESDILSLPNFHYASLLPSSSSSSSSSSSPPPPSKKGLKRLLKEVASLSSVLPLHPSSSVFVRVDENCPFVLQVLITGPEGTPYQNGCFLFDIFCKNYPSSPPLINLATTGGGSVRFNPNLYECGKVCLSLLGTWDGAAGETWDPKMSTLLQLFVSIQSLIFVEEPYFNEPGYEEEMDDPYTYGESEAYTKNIRKQTLRVAVVDQLENPPKGFEEVIRRHFSLKKDEVVKQAEEWLGQGQEELLAKVKKVMEGL